MTVNLQLPERPRREPIVVVAVQNNGRLVVDAALPEQFFELLHWDDVADERVAELGRPVPAHGAGNVALVVRRRVNVNLDDAHARVVAVLGDPLGRDEDIRNGIWHEVALPSMLTIPEI